MSASPPLPPPPPDPRPAEDDRPRRRVQRLTDASIALLLLLALGIVFVLDQHSPGKDALYSRTAGERFLFDPLREPIAAVRQNPERQQWIGAYGGTIESEAAVRRGLDWLARHQSRDGHWGPDALHAQPEGRCKPGDVCSEGGADHRVALTGLAVLAFQAGGHYDFNAAEYSGCVRHGLDWLLAHQRPDGAFFDPEHGLGYCNMYEHGIAAFALADACEMAASLAREPNDRYRQSAQKAVQFIYYAQHNDGGWRYNDDRTARSDVSVSGWQMLALNAAREADIVALGDDSERRMLAFFKSCEDQSSGRTFYQPGYNLPSDAPTAIGMLVHEFVLKQPDAPLVAAGAKYLAGEAESSFVQGRKPKKKKKALAEAPGDYYTFYNGTLAMFQAGGQPWKRWNDVIRDTIVERQCDVEEGCRRGSWDPLSHRWEKEGGRVYSTALAVLTLEVYYRYKSERAKVYP